MGKGIVLDTTYAFNTHNICPDTGDIYNLSVAIQVSEFISVDDLLAEIKRLTAEPTRRPVFTKSLGEFCQTRCGQGSIKSSWSDFDGAVSDLQISCTYAWSEMA